MEDVLRRQVVLVVDDDDIVQNMLVSFLTVKGFVVVGADDGLAAFSFLKNVAVDLVLSDVVMPRMDGINLLKKIRSSNIDVPIVFMSGHCTKDIECDINNFGAKLIAKPFKLEQLSHEIRRAVNG